VTCRASARVWTAFLWAERPAALLKSRPTVCATFTANGFPRGHTWGGSQRTPPLLGAPSISGLVPEQPGENPDAERTGGSREPTFIPATGGALKGAGSDREIRSPSGLPYGRSELRPRRAPRLRELNLVARAR